MKKIILVCLAAAMLVGGLSVTSSALSIGTGTQVLANDVNLIKSGLYGNPIRFSDADFKSALGTQSFKKVTITELPDEKDGSLMLGDRVLTEGQSIRRRNLGSLSFIPSSATVTESSFKFTVDELCGGAELECIMRFVEKVNYAPKVVTDTDVSLPITTQRGISVYGKLCAEDPEGDEVDYIIVSYPKYGTLSFTSDSEGEYCYTPNDSYRGNDEFVYVVRDEYGNYSYTQRVSLKVIDRMSEVSYIDTDGSKYENAVIAMTAMGVMSGIQVGDDIYFEPEKAVTRAEFVAMAMKAVGLRPDSTLKETFFDDNDEIPASLVGYVATAQKCGLVNGAFDGKGLYFRPQDPITKYEASIIMSKLMGNNDENVSVSFENMYSIPVWARDEVGAMFRLGIFESDEGITADATLSRLDAANYLYRLCNVKDSQG